MSVNINIKFSINIFKPKKEKQKLYEPSAPTYQHTPLPK